MTDTELLQCWMSMTDGMTQRQAAEILGVSQPAIHAILSGQNRLSRMGRQYVKHLIETTSVSHRRKQEMIDTPIPAEWLESLQRIVGEMIERREALAALKLPDVYQDNSYIMADVG